MKISISKSDISGRVRAPASKSYTIRGLMSAALAQGDSEIIYPLSSDDPEASLNVLRKIGVKIIRELGLWRITGDSFHKPETGLYCGDSAATLRFMMAICSLVPGECRLTAGPSLARRPVNPLVQALKKLGVDCSAQGGQAPVTVSGGKFRGGTTELAGNISSQFVSALLLIAPLAEEGMHIKLTSPLESKPYVVMTLDCLSKFGIEVKTHPDFRDFNIAPQLYQPTKYLVEGDWSSASYLLALGALSGQVTVDNLDPQSLQGDRILLSFLKEMGVRVDIDKHTITVRKSRLNALKANLTNSIDLLPTMAALAAVADGVSEFTGIERARIKESNRVLAVREGLERMGITVQEERDRFTVIGSMPKGAAIDTKDDHRIAMAFGVLGTVTGETIISNAECVAKTYPEFWDVLRNIGGEVKEDG